MPKFFIKTYGCQMNERDSEQVAHSLLARGYERVGHESEADVVLLNTCSVRDMADQKALGKMGMLGRLAKEKPQMVFGFLGCCLLYTSPSPRDRQKSRMPSSA